MDNGDGDDSNNGSLQRLAALLAASQARTRGGGHDGDGAVDEVVQDVRAAAKTVLWLMRSIADGRLEQTAEQLDMSDVLVATLAVGKIGRLAVMVAGGGIHAALARVHPVHGARIATLGDQLEATIVCVAAASPDSRLSAWVSATKPAGVLKRSWQRFTSDVAAWGARCGEAAGVSMRLPDNVRVRNSSDMTRIAMAGLEEMATSRDHALPDEARAATLEVFASLSTLCSNETFASAVVQLATIGFPAYSAPAELTGSAHGGAGSP